MHSKVIQLYRHMYLLFFKFFTHLDCYCLQSESNLKPQLWIFTGRTDAEAETPILWTPDVKSRLTGKDLDAEKDWGQEEKGMTEDEMVGWHH